MATKELVKPFRVPSLFDEFMKPWDSFFDVPGGRIWNKMFTTPPVNIMEYENEFKIELAAPGMKKEDFNIDIDNDMLTISAEKEEKKEEKFEEFTRNEYNFSSFTRSFTLPEGIKIDAIEAKYTDGVLKLALPKKEEFKKHTAMKHIAVK
jgi:HSP20 family protein